MLHIPASILLGSRSFACLLIFTATQTLCLPSGVTDLYTPEIACLCGEQHAVAMLSGCTARIAVSRAGVLFMPSIRRLSAVSPLKVQALLLEWALILSWCHCSLRDLLAQVNKLAVPASAF